MLSAEAANHNRHIATWLLICAAVIFSMILLGGVTRLTHSGLSMVEWKPLMGVIPPLSEAHWQQTFAKYQQFPEYQAVNRGMDLESFKSIFLFEYAHRLLGRLIGAIFLLPLLYFWLSGKINRRLTPKLVMIFILGGLQGGLGWYMVKSGLVDIPRVSQYRLVAHLGAAVIIYGVILWVAFGLLFDTASSSRRAHTANPLRGVAYTITGLLFVMILSGGLVAGTRAGFAYPTFPLMGESFIPGGLYDTVPAWLAIFEDITTVQFNHRMLAYGLIVLILCFAVWGLKREPANKPLCVGLYLLIGALLLQVGLGISTLLLHVPVPLAAAHQGGAVLLFSCSLYVSHCLRSRPSSAEALSASISSA